MRRHDLLLVDLPAWWAMLSDHPGLEDLPLVVDWAAQCRPVIVRRHMAGDAINGLPAALPLPPYEGKRRVAFSFASRDGVVTLPPVLLGNAAYAAPAAWQSMLEAVLDLGRSLDVAPGVFGSLLWEHVTGLRYMTQQSDLDLLWPVTDPATVTALVSALVQLEAGSPIRLDGELTLPDGGGVNWRELIPNRDGGADTVLVKTMEGVELRPTAGLFTPVVCVV